MIPHCKQCYSNFTGLSILYTWYIRTNAGAGASSTNLCQLSKNLIAATDTT